MESGILLHKYINASDDPAAYDAEQAKRQGVTVAFAYEHLCDEALWIHNSKVFEGCDPWIEITSIDKLIKPDDNGNEYILQFGRTGELKVSSLYRVFAQRSKLEIFMGEYSAAEKFMYDALEKAYKILCSGQPPHSARESNARRVIRSTLEQMRKERGYP